MKHLLPLLILSSQLGAAAPLIKETIATGLRDPMEVAIAADGDLYVVEREGRVLRINPKTGGTFVIGNIEVEALRSTNAKSDYAREDGLLGIALDPDFGKNQRLFLFYSAPDIIACRLSRFTLKDGLIDPSSELKLLEIPTERTNRVCHLGGSVEFGPDGLLYVSIGDNTNPFASAGHAPIDDRDDRAEFDAQRSAGNTNDLRGKIIRIKPTETGYEIPPGNLFPPGTPQTRPEIYVMGCRNPFRISIDPITNSLYWGEVGPDARENTPRGPLGYDEINQARAAGNFGWPFVIANNQPYPIYDFGSNQPGLITDPAAPENPGQRNTGLKTLPTAESALIWYPYAKSEEFPAMGEGGRNAMAGPVFYYEDSKSYNILDRERNRTLLTYEWMRGRIYAAQLDENENLTKLEVLLDKLTHPMDLEMDRDGSLILLEYGSDWYFNRNGSVSRLRPDDGGKPPILSIRPDPANQKTFTINQATDPDGGNLSIAWYLTEGAVERRLGSSSTVTIPDGSFQEIRAIATNDKGAFSIARIPLSGDGELPTLELELSESKEKLDFTNTLRFKVTAENLPDPSAVTVRARYILPTGHDAGGPELGEDATKLLTARQCIACHQVNSGIVGPSLLDVALRYKDKKDAVPALIEKLIIGGVGNWGDTPMPPQPAVTAEESGKLISAILGLAEGITETRGTLSGSIRLSPKGDLEAGGAWEISAEAPGFAPFRTRLPAK